jgi:hypothetical protein
MSELVTIVVSGGGASEKMLTTCLEALGRHRGETHSTTLVVAPSHQMAESWAVTQKMGIPFRSFGVGQDRLSGSRTHASVLDQVVPHVETPYMLTLDADCFPVADDWLDELMDMIGEGAAVAGILHPYAPPMGMSRCSIEYRIRSQLCNLNTHVACQLVGVETLTRRLRGIGFSDGDDTGLAIPVQARKMGMRVRGLPLTGCAKVDHDWQEMESNRECCLMFGDKVYHHGGGSREVQDKGSPLAAWNDVRKRVLEEGAEFLLKEDGALFRYEFLHEEEVAEQMVSRIMRGMRIYLETHDRAFKE